MRTAASFIGQVYPPIMAHPILPERRIRALSNDQSGHFLLKLRLSPFHDTLAGDFPNQNLKGEDFMRSMTLFTTAALLALVAAGGAQEKKGGGKKGGGIQLPPMIHITISDFKDGGNIPSKYTCAAGPTSPSPAISWTGAPATTQSYA